jgi:hypothetical protein
MPRWSNQEYADYCARQAKNKTRPLLPPAEPEQNASRSLVETKTGKAEDSPRIVLRVGIRIYRLRLQDADNATGGCKALIDCLVAIGLLPGDSTSEIDLQVEQIKVAHRADEKTVVEIL